MSTGKGGTYQRQGGPASQRLASLMGEAGGDGSGKKNSTTNTPLYHINHKTRYTTCCAIKPINFPFEFLSRLPTTTNIYFMLPWQPLTDQEPYAVTF
ncbi:unnamed protein product [Merluccius merluccius]